MEGAYSSAGMDIHLADTLKGGLKENPQDANPPAPLPATPPEKSDQIRRSNDDQNPTRP